MGGIKLPMPFNQLEKGMSSSTNASLAPFNSIQSQRWITNWTDFAATVYEAIGLMSFEDYVSSMTTSSGASKQQALPAPKTSNNLSEKYNFIDKSRETQFRVAVATIKKWPVTQRLRWTRILQFLDSTYMRKAGQSDSDLQQEWTAVWQ